VCKWIGVVLVLLNTALVLHCLASSDGIELWHIARFILTSRN
jgi:hypothetical protein